MSAKKRPMKLLRVIEGLTFEQIKAKLEGSPYNCKVKEDNTYYIINYDQINSDFSNEVVRQCRGIILRKDNNKIVCHPFHKFFNWGEKYAARIDWNTARIQEKVDGSIIKVWFDDGFWHVSTNGTIDASSAELPDIKGGPDNFYDLWISGFANSTSRPLKSNWNTDYTYMFEIVSPWNRIVVPYKKTAIFHIGTRDNVTGKEIDIDIGIPKPREFQLSSLEDVVSMAESLPFNEEGYVVVDKNWNRIKVKGAQYVMCHRLKGNSFSHKRAFDMLKSGENEEFLSYFPEYTDEFEEVLKVVESIKSYLREKNNTLKTISFSSRKEFAIYISDWYFKSYFFMKLDGKISNIEDYISSIDWKNIPSYFLN